MAKRRVVLTGASGYVAQRMFKELSERWDIVPIDVRPTTRDGKPVPGIIVADLTNPDRNAYRQHFRGADAVIHCGFVRAPGMTADTWQDNSDAKFQAEHAPYEPDLRAPEGQGLGCDPTASSISRSRSCTPSQAAGGR